MAVFRVERIKDYTVMSNHHRMHYCIPKPSLEINSVTATAKIAEVTLYAIGSLKNSNRHAESITIANLNFTSLRTATSSSAFK